MLKEIGPNVTVSGMIIVFVMLIVLVLIMQLFGYFANRAQKNTKKNSDGMQKIQRPENTDFAAPVVFDDGVDDETAAVIAAAVYAMYSCSKVTPKIKMIRPAERSAWAFAGIVQNTKAF